MLTIMVIAHLLGDYLFQLNIIARWKARSLWGVVAHGAIVTLTTLVCAALVDVAWWPFALLIGFVHTGIDLIKAHVIKAKNPREEMVYYLLDQIAHFGVIVFMVLLSRGGEENASNALARYGVAPHVLAFVVGYLLLLQPAWVLLRFIVRGIWGAEAAPHLGAGEKFEPMMERVLITSLIVAGQFYWIPLVLLPRRLTSVRVQGNGTAVAVWVRLTTHWAETALSVVLSVMVGILLRWVILMHP